MTCMEKELRWIEHTTLLKKFRRGEASINDVFESAKKLPIRCSKSERDSETRGREYADNEREILLAATQPA